MQLVNLTRCAMLLSVSAPFLIAAPDTCFGPGEEAQQETADAGGGGDVDAGAADSAAEQDATLAPCQDFAGLRQDALDNGVQILDGVGSGAATPIAEVLADLDGFDGQFIQIEGRIVGICQSQGCYADIVDAAGNQLQLKLTDGVVDFRDFAEVGLYAVGEGIFNKVGEHGAMVFIDDHGAMIGTVNCAE